MNPMNFILNMIQSGGSPQQIILEYLQQQNDPLSTKLLPFAQTGNSKELEQLARQLCSQRGVDFDSEFKAFKQRFRL